MGKTENIKITELEIEKFCKKHHIKKFSFFGSVLGNNFNPDSDIDVLVEFEAGRVVGFFRLTEIEQELSEIFGTKVDLRTPAELSRYFRQAALDSAEVQYVEG